MKVKYYLNVLVASILSLLSVSCDSKDPGSEVKPNNKFTLEISGSIKHNAEESLSVSVNVGDYDGLYIIGMISEEIYNTELSGSDEEYARYYINYVQGAGSSLNKPDEKYVFKGSSKQNLAVTWTPNYDTKYKVFAFGVTPEGEAATDIFSVDYTTESEPVKAFELTMSGSSVDDLAAEVKVSDDFDGDYVVGVALKSFFVNNLSSNADQLPDFVLGQAAMKTEGSYEVGNGYIFNGDSTVDLASAWDLEGSTEYVIVCAALKTYDNGTGEVIICDLDNYVYDYATTDEVVAKESKLAISLIGKVGHLNVDLKIDNPDGIEYYMVQIMTEYEFTNQAGSDPAVAAAQVISSEYSMSDDTDFTTIPNAPIYSGSSAEYHSSEFTNLNISSKYVALAFGIDAKANVTSEVATYSFTTSDGPEPIEVAFEIAPVADFGPDNFAVDVKVDNKEINYIAAIYEARLFDSKDMDAYFYDQDKNPDYGAALKSLVGDLSFWWYLDEEEEQVNVDYGVADGVVIFNGDATIDMSKYTSAAPKPETEYIIIVAGIDDMGYITTNIEHISATTCGVEDTGLVLSFEEIKPAKLEGYGYAGAVRVTPSDPAATYICTISIASNVDGLTDEEIYAANNIQLIAPFSQVSGTFDYAYSYAEAGSYIIAFGYSNGGLSSEIYKFKIN